jgi:UDP-4-amino-4,6-dideoxy-N-acetyl-beta-L-altrosamine transaminase
MLRQESTFLPYGRQSVTQDDIEAVVRVLRGDWLTQGPTIKEFESALGNVVGAPYATACSSGTAALHLAMLALRIGAGDEIVVSANTFLATANCARYVGANVKFADIDASTGNISIDSIQQILEKDREHRIKAIIPTHFAGQPCELESIRELSKRHGARLVDDACHALGAAYRSDTAWHKIGSGDHSDMTVFSFHPVKHVAMGEGGAITTSDTILAERLSVLRSHGMIRSDFSNEAMALAQNSTSNPWYYEMKELGYNYRLTDIQAALGISQLMRLKESLARRREIAQLYHRLLEEKFTKGEIVPLNYTPDVLHAYHLFVVKIDFKRLGVDRATVMNRLRYSGIGTQVHYIPVPLQPYYGKLYGYVAADFPGAMSYYGGALSLPMYPALLEADVERVVEQLGDAVTREAGEYVARA